MDEMDLFKTLSQDRNSLDVKEYLEKMKTAGVADGVKGYVRTVATFAKNNPKELAAAGLGAVGSAALQYMASKPKKDGLSIEQRSTRAAADSFNKDKKENFPSQMTGATLNYSKELADVFAKHPGKAALTMAPIGAGAAYSVAKKLFRK